MVQKESNYTRFRFISEKGFQDPEFQIEYESINDTTETSPDVYLCKEQTAGVLVPNQSNLVFKSAFQCGDGDTVNALNRCDGKFDCLNHADEKSCPQNDNGQVIHISRCRNGDPVSYSMYCDFVQDCADGSDENCVFPDCHGDEVRCDNGQCIAYTALCNGYQECFDGSDESQRFCASVPSWWQSDLRRLAQQGCNNTTDEICDFGTCLCGQLKCTRSYCIDVAKLCDGQLDCPHREDERTCKLDDIPRNTSNFRCQNNRESLCLSNSHVCDGKVDCTLADDERLCAVNTCPAPCTCKIFEVRCNNLDKNNMSEIAWTLQQNTRYLDIAGSDAADKIIFGQLRFNLLYLVYLDMSNCNIKTLANDFFTKMPNLIELDLSKNNLIEFKSMLGLSKIRKLDLGQNDIKYITLDDFVEYSELEHLILSNNVISYTHRTTGGEFTMLHTLDISYNNISTLSEFNNFQIYKMINLRILLLNNNKINETEQNAFLGLRNTILLNLSHNEIARIEADTFAGMELLNVLDLSFNKMSRIENGTFHGIKSIQDIDLSHNEIYTVDRAAFTDIHEFKGTLILNNNLIEKLLTNMFGILDNLAHLSLTNNKIENVEDEPFQGLYNLKSLDISGNNIQAFADYLFLGPRKLINLKTDDYKFCCLKPMTVTFDNCTPKADEFSSCEDLMRNVFASHMMCVIAVVAVTGNLATFFYRIIYDKEKTKKSYGLFVTNLSVSDFIMGIYLVIIVAADFYYQGSYTWNAHSWRNSALCKFAGVISTLSSEASVFFLCLITLDRIFVIKWPLGQVRFGTKSAPLASAFAWLLAISIAILPVLYTDYFGDEFCSVNGVCIGLPLTRARPRGWEYSLAVFVCFNFLTFLLIALGQVMIFAKVQCREKLDTSVSSRRKVDLTVARNLLFVVLTDFMCWVPIGVMGIIAIAGHTVSGDVYVWTSVFILPVNAALNPCLYTLSGIIKNDKFVPQQDEQRQLISITMNMKKWKAYCKRSPLFHLKTSQTSLTALFRKRCLKPFEALLIQMELAYQLEQIHTAGLNQGDISLDMIKLFLQNDEIVTVAVDLLPKSCNNEYDRKGDIYQLGKIGQALINRANESTAGSSHTTADIAACGSAN